jgi:hypothetical protein
VKLIDGEPPTHTQTNSTLTALVKIGSILACLFAIVTVLDMILPRQLTIDRLIEKGAVHTKGRHPTHEVYFNTSKFHFTVNMSIFNAVEEGDSIPIYHTPIFKKPIGFSLTHGDKIKTWTISGWWYVTCITLAGFVGFSSYVNLQKDYEPDTAFKAGIAAFVFAVVLYISSNVF